MKSQLTPCKACGKSIAKSATTCPHCGKSSTSLARIGLLVILTLLILLFMGGGRIILDLMQRHGQVSAAQERLERMRGR